MADIKLDVKVYPINEPKGSARAFASVGIEDLIAIRGIRVIEGDKGLFVSMPQSKNGEGKYFDIAFPLTADLRKDITQKILDEYNAVDKSIFADKSKKVEKTAEPKKTLAEGLREGAAKAAEQAPRASAAKAKGAAIV